MVRTWHLTPTQSIELDRPDKSSLDAVTRQLPEGYYSTFRTYNDCTRVLGLKAHLRRLYDPISKPELNASSLRRRLVRLLEPYPPGEARVRVTITNQGQLYVAIEPLKPLPHEVYEQGVRVETTEIKRESPRLKSTAFISASDEERRYIVQEGIFEALLAKNGKILEGMTSNFFYVFRSERGREASQTKGEILYTAQREILLGVTRRTVIHVARGRGLEVKFRPLKQDQLSAVGEAFITSSSRGIVPVVQVNGVTVGQGRVGPLTRELMLAYEMYVSKKAGKISPDG